MTVVGRIKLGRSQEYLIVHQRLLYFPLLSNQHLDALLSEIGVGIVYCITNFVPTSQIFYIIVAYLPFPTQTCCKSQTDYLQGFESILTGKYRT